MYYPLPELYDYKSQKSPLFVEIDVDCTVPTALQVNKYPLCCYCSAFFAIDSLPFI
jgi:hypothetical protein